MRPGSGQHVADRPRRQDDGPGATIHSCSSSTWLFVFTDAVRCSSTDLSTLAQVVLIFVVLFWMYSGYVWLTNQVPPVTTASRLLLIAGMAGFLVCALAVPHASTATASPLPSGSSS